MLCSTYSIQASEFHGSNRFGSAEVPGTSNLLNRFIGSHQVVCGLMFDVIINEGKQKFSLFASLAQI